MRVPDCRLSLEQPSGQPAVRHRKERKSLAGRHDAERPGLAAPPRLPARLDDSVEPRDGTVEPTDERRASRAGGRPGLYSRYFFSL
jgi:hypothetical protein